MSDITVLDDLVNELAAISRERDDLAAIVHDLSADDANAYGRGHNDGWRDALAAAAGACDARRQEHRGLNKQVRTSAGYDENGPSGDVAHMTAALAEACNICADVIRSLRPPVPHRPSTREASLRALLARCRPLLGLYAPGHDTEALLADIDAALASQE